MTKNSHIQTVAALWTGLFIAHPVMATDTPGDISYDRDVRLLLSENCGDCHGPEDSQSGLRLDRRSAGLRGGDSGESAFVPGDASKSLLIRLVKGHEPDRKMPPDGAPLSDDQILVLERWIDQGAHWSEPTGSNDSLDADLMAPAETLAKDHWSLRPIQRPDVPEQAGCQNPIDAFIDRQLRDNGFDFSPRSDAVSLTRRVSLVLTGLPPSDVVESDPVSYQAFVDQTLASPRYGERWAQHWLDVIRWAETVGFETNQERRQAWPYRDWVIDAFNRDLPYDQFIRDQILGDRTGQDAALGFLVAGPANLPGQIGRDEEAMRQARQDELDEVIQTVSQSIMGLTVGCARCHNHKFDPILQKDYYSMQAIFAGLSFGQRRWRGEEDDRQQSQVPTVAKRLKTLERKTDELRRRYELRPSLPSFPSESFDAIAADAVRMQIAATHNGGPASLYELQAWSSEADDSPSKNVALASTGGRASASSFALANQTRHFDNLIDGSVDRRQAFPWVAARPGPAWVRVDFDSAKTINRIAWDTGGSIPVDLTVQVRDANSQQWITVATSRDRMLRTDDGRDAQDVVMDGLSNYEVANVLTAIKQVRQTHAQLARLKAGPQVYAASFRESPDSTWQLRRGDPMQRIGMVPPSTPAVLGVLLLGVDAPDQDRRRALVGHLTSPDHPLTARVIVNRIWQKHFGVGIVDTPSDFGTMGSSPSHPELLDWLASELIENQWSMKHIHRLILNSRTFQQASMPNQDALAIDADSRLLWRFPPRRIEAESIRDSILRASGKLNFEMGGRGFNFFRQRGGLADYNSIETFDQDGWRRMIYAHKIRMQSVDVFGSFDCPDAGQMKPRRTQSITPLQSLSLLNSPFVNRQAKFFAERIETEIPHNTERQIDRAFEIAFSRKATNRERQSLSMFVRDEGLEQLCRVLFNTSEFLYLR